MTSPSPWPELGINPTTDQGAIRRAYAVRLKMLGVDGEPVSFMQLRQAYESALSAARGDLPSADATTKSSFGSPAALLPETPGAAPEWQISGIAFARFCTAFETALGAGDSERAGSALQVAMAQGVLPLGLEEDFTAHFLACARDDAALSPEALTKIIAMFGVAAEQCGHSRLAALFDDIKARIQALHWLAVIDADVARGNGGIRGMLRRRFNRRVRVGRAIRAGRASRLGKCDLPLARAELAAALRHAPWLDDRLDLARFEAELTQRERHFQPSLLSPLMSFTFLVATGVTANNGGNEILSLLFFALALISIGGWILPSFGLILLVAIAQLILGL